MRRGVSVIFGPVKALKRHLKLAAPCDIFLIIGCP